MATPWDDWDHIVKLDPDKELVGDETFEDVCATGTDAIMIGGSTGITVEKMERVIDACAAYNVPLYQEPNQPDIVVESTALDGYLVPTVFNAGHPFWITGAHKEWLRIDDNLDWSKTATEAYIVLNPDSAVAELTEADCDLDVDDVAAYATVAERMFGQEIVYVEYSGTLGDPETVGAAHEALGDAVLFYGGGIHDYESAHELSAVSDVTIVGNLVHDAGVDAVAETVDAAHDARD